MFGWLSSEPLRRYELQMQNVDELVLHCIKDKKGVDITKEELNLILEALYEWRIVE